MVSATLLHEALLAIAPEARVIPGHAHDEYMEIMRFADMTVWMCETPVSREDYDSFEVESGWMKSGFGPQAMDLSAFHASPGAPCGMRRIGMDERAFLHVARPLERVEPETEDGPMQVNLDKRHLIGFAAGREVAVLHTDEGLFVEVIGTREHDEALLLPPGARLDSVTPAAPWIIDLPMPTSALFWMGHHLRSFQGPVAPPEQIDAS